MRLESGSTQRPRRELIVRIAEESGHPLDLFLDEDDDEETDKPMRVVVPITIEISDARIDSALQRVVEARFRKSNDRDAHLEMGASRSRRKGDYQ